MPFSSPIRILPDVVLISYFSQIIESALTLPLFDVRRISPSVVSDPNDKLPEVEVHVILLARIIVE